MDSCEGGSDGLPSGAGRPDRVDPDRRRELGCRRRGARADGVYTRVSALHRLDAGADGEMADLQGGIR